MNGSVARLAGTCIALFLVSVTSLSARSDDAAQRTGSTAGRSVGAPQDGSATFNDDPGTGSTDHCGDIDPTEPCYTSGGGYAYCIARKSDGQECRDVVTIYTAPGTICSTGCRTCAGVTFSASCQCDSATLKLTGTCTYW